jgi:hypothetical protein
LVLAAGVAHAQPETPRVPAPPAATLAVHGRVVDAFGKPIAGATISVDSRPDLHAAVADAQGRYRLDGAELGAELVIAAEGYEAALIAVTGPEVGEVVLLSLKQAHETIELSGRPPPDTAGAAQLDREEVRRIPGTGDDLVRSLTAMPGVVNAPLPTAYNGIVIRGSAPEDSKFLIDGFEVPALYHDIGFRSIVPTEAIDTLDYIPGGFGVEYGRAASGIVALTTRPGSDTRTEQVELAAIDSGALAQGKTGKLRYMISFRRSVIDLLLPLILPSNLDLSLTTVPRYYDEQLRLDYEMSPRLKLTFSSIGSDDALEIYTDKAENPDKRFYNRTRFIRFIAGARYSDGPWTANVGISAMPLEFIFDRGLYQFIDVQQLALDSRAEVTRTWKGVAGLRDLVWRAGASSNVSRFDVSLALPPQPREGSTAGATFPDPKDTSNKFSGITWTPDFAAWSALTAGLSPDVRVTGGVRIDALARTGDFAVQPRGELQYKLDARTTARFSAGAYRRPPENQEELEHADLHPERSTQLITGVMHEPFEGLRLQGSLYYTDRSHLIIRGDDGVLRNSGRGTTTGAELLGTYRVGSWFAWLSASLSHSVRHDTPTAQERLFEFDQPVSINAALSWRGRKWQLGGRFQLYSGLPYTPVIGSIYDSDANFYDPLFGKVYSERAPYHHQLDVRVDRFFRWGPAQMNWFLDVQNVYLNQSTVAYFYSYDYSQRSAFRSLPIIPSVGLRGVF